MEVFNMALQEGRNEVVYQANEQTVKVLQQVTTEVHTICKQYSGKFVRVQTVDGLTYEGKILYTHAGYLHLIVAGPEVEANRGLFNPYWNNYNNNNNVVLPLVLYNLLVISLL